jgi:predicted NBD/HSP70 family sugar kinase
MTSPQPSVVDGTAVERLLAAMRAGGPMTQTELARNSDLAAATVSVLVRRLAAEGQVLVRPARRGGRPANEVLLNATGDVVAGVDVGHRHVRVALSTLDYGTIAEEDAELPADHDADSTLRLARDLLGEALRRSASVEHTLVRAAMGLPAPIETGTGRVGSSSILRGWVDVHPATALSDLIGVPVEIDNDANLGALAELVWGAGRGHRDFAYVKVSHGLGAGLVLDGNLYRGAAGTAGELGHLTLEEGGPVCRCGNRGCVEMLAATHTLLEALRAVYGDVDLPWVIEQAAGGDHRCRRVLADCGRQVGRAVAALCVLLNPEKVAVGGAVAAAGAVFLDPLRAEVQRLAVVSAAQTPIVAAQLGPRIGALGATARAIQAHLAGHVSAGGRARIKAGDASRGANVRDA